MDLLTAIIFAFLGILAGTFTGMIPGVHINMISAVVIAYYGILSNFFEIQAIIVFIISMSLTHTFISFIPSVTLGVPQPDNAIAILPAHNMILKGKGYEAIFLNNLGSLYGILAAFLISMISFFILERAYDLFRIVIPYFLLSVMTLIIILEKEKNKIFWATIIAIFSGGLGLFALNTPIINNPLLILFSGLFGLSGILYSIKDETAKLPKQSFKINFKHDLKFFKSMFAGTMSSWVCSISPGVGSAQAATISTLFFKDLNQKMFLLCIGSINTINFILSIMTFFIIERARNGSIIAVSQIIDTISLREVIFYYVIIGFVGVFVFFLTLELAKFSIKRIEKVNVKKLNFAVICFIIILVFMFDRFYGILILVCATALGICSLSLGIKRVHMMAVLLIPVSFNLL